MRRPLMIAACIGLATVAGAQKTASSGITLSPATTSPAESSSTNFFTPTIVSTTQNSGSTTVVLDISGVPSVDGAGDPDNTLIDLPIPAGALVTGIGWDVNQSTVGLSWLSEMTIGFDNTDPGSLVGLALAPSITDAPGVEANSSGGIVDFTDNALSDIPIQPDGILRFEFFEAFVDTAGLTEGVWDSPSTLTIVYEGGSAVPTVGQWGLIVLGLVLLGGVVFMTVRQKKALSVN